VHYVSATGAFIGEHVAVEVGEMIDAVSNLNLVLDVLLIEGVLEHESPRCD
jgi:hypothetical protein